MSCEFCGKVRAMISAMLPKGSFESWYLREFKQRFNPQQNMLYIKNGQTGAEKLVAVNVSFASPVDKAFTLKEIALADALADVSTGKVFKSRHTDENFERFFNRYIRSFDKLEALYADYLRRESHDEEMGA